MLICILHYGKIYNELKRLEGKPMYEGGDGPMYNTTLRPQRYDTRDSTDEDSNSEQQFVDEEHNINMSNNEMRQSFGLQNTQQQQHNMHHPSHHLMPHPHHSAHGITISQMRYTNTTNRASSIASTEHSDEESVDSMANLKHIHG